MEQMKQSKISPVILTGLQWLQYPENHKGSRYLSNDTLQLSYLISTYTFYVGSFWADYHQHL